MRQFLLVLVISILLTNAVKADFSVSILQGKAISGGKAALYVSAVDDAGRPIKGLSGENFELLVSGEKVEGFTVEPVPGAEEALSLVLGIDVSGSMKGKPFEETQNAVTAFLLRLDKEDMVSLLSFGAEVRFLVDFTNDKYQVEKEVKKLSADEDWTHLYDATYMAIDTVKDAPTTRTAIVLLTDGRDERSTRHRQEAIDKATGGSVPIFTIGYGHQIDREYLEEIAGVSGGYFLFTPEPEGITGLYDKVLEQLKNQYMISFDFAKDPGYYKANISLNFQNGLARGNKEFLFSPENTKIPPPDNGILKYIIGAALVLIIACVLIVILIKKPPPPPPPPSPPCELEYPGECPTFYDFIESRSGSLTKVNKISENILLKVDCLNDPIPLVGKDKKCLDELMIARKTENVELHKKSGVAYLWATDKRVSRPKEGRHGHARIFLMVAEERFAVEDLGSASGTLLNGIDLRNKGPAPLRDEDVIDIGGKGGMRIVYRENMPETESGMETTTV